MADGPGLILIYILEDILQLISLQDYCKIKLSKIFNNRGLHELHVLDYKLEISIASALVHYRE